MVGGYISVNVWIKTTIELTAKVKRRKVARSSGVSSALPLTTESHICKEWMKMCFVSVSDYMYLCVVAGYIYLFPGFTDHLFFITLLEFVHCIGVM